MEVEDEEEIPPLEHNQFIILVFSADVSLGSRQEVILPVKVLHSLVKSIQMLVAQQVVIDKIPLASSIMIALKYEEKRQ